MKIRFNLILAFLGVSGLVVLVGLLGFNYTDSISSKYSSFQNENVQIIDALREMQDSALRLDLHTHHMQILISHPESDSKEISNVIKKIGNEKLRFYENFRNYKISVENNFPDEISHIQNIEARYNDFILANEKLITQILDDPRSSKVLELNEILEEKEVILFSEIDKALENERREFVEIQNSVESDVKNSLSFLSVIIWISFIFSISLGLVISNSVSGSLNKIRKATHKIAKGDFETKLPASEKDELNELINDINFMANELKDYEQKILKSERLTTIGELAARLAHDLRNPLAIIKVTIEMIENRYGKTISEKERDDFQRLHRAIDRLSHQIEEVLDFVKTKPPDLQTTKISSLLCQTINSISVPNNVSIKRLVGDEEISCDVRQMEVVFSNLIKNSIQAFDGNVGEIKIQVKQDEKYTEIVIKDSGPGIPNDILDEIFTPLFTTKQEGTGLGLVSCKKIIEQHEGSISVKNNPTTFTIKIPNTIKLVTN